MTSMSETIHIKSMKRGLIYKVLFSDWPQFRVGDLVSVEEFSPKYIKQDGILVLDQHASLFITKNNTTGKIVKDVSDNVYLTQDLYA